MRIIVSIFVFVAMFTAIGRADEIRLADGRVLDGRILRVELNGRGVETTIEKGKLVAPEGARVVIERPYGTLELAASEIVAVELRFDLFDRADQLTQAAGRDLGARLAVARWCDERDLGRRKREILKSILADEPDLEEAHEMLGEVLTSKGWKSKSEARALERVEARAAKSEVGDQRVEKARLARLQRTMRRLASGIYSQSARESERSYLALLELARKEEIAGLAPIAARFYRDAAEQRAALASATVTVNLQQASLLGLRERSLNLGAGGAVRVQLPESRLIGLGTTVSVPLR